MWGVGESGLSRIGFALWWRRVNLWQGFWPLHCTVCEKIRCHYCTILFGGVCKCWQGSGTKQLVMRTEAAAIQIDTSLQLSVDFCTRSRPPLNRQKYVDRGSIPNQLCRFPLDLASSFCQRGGMGGAANRERKKERELPPDLGHRYLAHPPTFSLDEQAALTERSKHILPTSLSLHPLIEEQTSLIERSTSCLKEPKQKNPLFLFSEQASICRLNSMDRFMVQRGTSCPPLSTRLRNLALRIKTACLLSLLEDPLSIELDRLALVTRFAHENTQNCTQWIWWSITKAQVYIYVSQHWSCKIRSQGLYSKDLGGEVLMTHHPEPQHWW